MHLVAPGWNVIGGGEPVLPGVSIGHNEHGAWGLTIFGNDNEDLYVYDTNPANAERVSLPGSWEAMRVIADTIPVKGEKPEAVELKYTRHGPVLFEDRANRQGLRAARGVAGAGRRAVSRQPADESGDDLGGVPRGVQLQPHAGGEHGVGRSQRHDRLAGGRHSAAAPQLERPAAGARRRPLRVGRLPADHGAAARGEPVARVRRDGQPLPVPERLSRTRRRCTSRGPIRIAPSRITEVLGSGRLFSVAEMTRLQNDDLSLPARALVPLLRDVSLPNAGQRQGARRCCTTWDFVLDKDSVAAGIYAMWQRRLIANTRAGGRARRRARSRRARTSDQPSG